MSSDKKVPLLVLGSTIFSLLVCEVGLRLFTRYGASTSPRQAQGTALAATVDKLLDTGEAARYVAQLAAAPGTDRRWFTEDPSPLPNRSPVSAQRMKRSMDFERRGIFAPQADYLWNRYYVESERCGPNNVFQNYPDTVLVFDPPVEGLHPRYRFPPSTTMRTGLVTNEFGLRGPPLTLAKPPKTIRIAFVGASTTVGFHDFPFSYPERVTYWLNRFAEASHLDVRFEALNAGREGLNSEDLAAIVRDEVLPLDPDLVVYYEGSNQFGTANLLVSPRIPPRREIDPRDPIVEHKVPELIRTHVAMGELLDRALNRFNSVGEPRKPFYRLKWPAGVDERNPDVDNPNLPLQLPVIVKDLDSIRKSLESIGGQLVLCSFEWLARDDLPLSATRHQYIYKQLNTSLWPLRYADIRRLADFQNHVFRRYAAARGIPFVDVASATPQDPNLFSDAIHMTNTGERLKAWIVFEQLVPILRRQIESGKLPHGNGSQHPPPPPSLAASEMTVRCPAVPSGPLERIDGAISLETIEPVYNGAPLEYGPPVKVITGVQKWSYAALFTLNLPAGLTRPCYLFVRARAVNGLIGLGVLDWRSGTFQTERAVAPSPDMTDIYVPLLFPDHADALVVRNAAEDGVRSEILIEDAELLAFLKPPPEEVVKVMALDRTQLGDRAASLQRGPEGLLVTTGPGLGAFAARVALGLDAGAGTGLKVHAWVRVIEGKIGLGILTPGSKTFLLERQVWPSAHSVEVILPLPSPPVTGDLILRNIAAGQVTSKAILERVEVRKLP